MPCTILELLEPHLLHKLSSPSMVARLLAHGISPFLCFFSMHPSSSISFQAMKKSMELAVPVGLVYRSLLLSSSDLEGRLSAGWISPPSSFHLLGHTPLVHDVFHLLHAFPAFHNHPWYFGAVLGVPNSPKQHPSSVAVACIIVGSFSLTLVDFCLFHTPLFFLVCMSCVFFAGSGSVGRSWAVHAS